MYHQRFKSADERFDEKYTIEPDGCWIWKTGLDSRHPDFRFDRGYVKASHFSWQRANECKLREGEQVLHTCDTPRCVNPEHLFIGDHKLNMEDKARKNRSHHPAGTSNGRAKITYRLADEIRAQYATGLISQQKIADRLGLNQTTVSGIIRGVNWVRRS